MSLGRCDAALGNDRNPLQPKHEAVWFHIKPICSYFADGHFGVTSPTQFFHLDCRAQHSLRQTGPLYPLALRLHVLGNLKSGRASRESLSIPSQSTVR